jgi:hypothetical protein
MRRVSGYRRLPALLLAGLVLAAMGCAGAAQAGAIRAGGGAPAQTRAARAGKTPAAGSARTGSTTNVGTPRVLTRYGNPDGHAHVPPAARAVSTAHPNHVIGNGSPAGCTSAAVVRAVAKGGIITFNCGPRPVTILMKATAKVVNTSHRIVLDGGGKVTLSGGGKIRILYMNTCDPKQKYTTDDCWEQKWPQLIVQNITIVHAYSGVRETGTSSYGGGAIFDEGGQLKVVNSGFFDDGCYASGPDLGGAAIRALGMYMATPVYITNDTFHANKCSNGAALSGLYANFYVINSLMTDNKAIGWGANPAKSGTPGGGSGGAIYTDGDHYNLVIDGSLIEDNSAREGGGGIFFVVDAGGGTLKIEYSAMHRNPSGEFQNAPGIFDEVDGVVTRPVEIHSTVN